MNRKLKGIFLGAIVLFLFFVAAHPASVIAQGADPSYYLQYCQFINESGLSGFKKLVDWYALDVANRVHPSPVRIGYLILGAGIFKIFGPSYVVLCGISLASFFLFLFVSWFYCRKHFGSDMAFALLVLLSSSPLLVGMGRMALTESLINLLWGTAVWMFLDLMKTPSRRTYWILVSVVTFALLCKESSVILIIFMLLSWLVFSRLKQCFISRPQIIGLTFAPLLLAFAILMTVLGGFNEVLTAARSFCLTHFSATPSSYALEYSSGPWFRYLVDFMLLSPLTTLGFIGYTGYIILNTQYKWEELYFLLYYVLVYSVLNIAQHTKVVRFAINLDMIMCLFTVFLIFQWSAKRGYQSTLILACLVGVFALNVDSFMRIFYLTGLLDPITFHLVSIRGMIPNF